MGQISGSVKQVYVVLSTKHYHVKRWGRGVRVDRKNIRHIAFLLFFKSGNYKLRRYAATLKEAKNV